MSGSPSRGPVPGPGDPSPVPPVRSRPPVPDREPVPDPALVARLRASGCVFAEDEAALLTAAAPDAAALEAMVRRRIAGLPLEHVLGWAEFRGLRVAVGPGVFVPRRRSEYLVDRALALGRPGALVTDLCCGSGALGLALATALGAAALHAADIDAAAVDCARRNLAPVGGTVHQGDLYEALPGALRGRIDILLANVPYVPSGEVPLLPAEAREHEPLTALDGGGDGLDVLRRVSGSAREWLAPGGVLLVETGARQSARAARLFTEGGLTAEVHSDAEEQATVVVGTRPRS
ncbi:Methytransferase [Streptomyces albus]|uniref:peptide chain release factor N(5)-glutamine methyltransferase n=1 Tax=Streptomyces albus (strain ATCC 21838 / DSM 41398 / FERM P-419 / JCM 4703 / NBRC 107858) TaxID=1081613 RepID=A0A0B5EJD7_STRA4|nr:Methytransferase [Streptomyces albus]AOU76673.1 Methytransferase [Streptomyces albus]AYN32452.1 putative protein N(5)-glutamine methyltransferase [Streptomyces albus]